jgi:hypothetical protein
MENLNQQEIQTEEEIKQVETILNKELQAKEQQARAEAEARKQAEAEARKQAEIRQAYLNFKKNSIGKVFKTIDDLKNYNGTSETMIELINKQLNNEELEHFDRMNKYGYGIDVMELATLKFLKSDANKKQEARFIQIRQEEEYKKRYAKYSK